jgi:Fe-S-cluster containining protein
MRPPMRKIKKSISKEEMQYIVSNFDTKAIELMHINEIEYDVPEADRLENDIEEQFKIINGKPLELYNKFLYYTDKFNIILNKYSPCKKGCANCCIIPVEISHLEKNKIKKYLEDTKEMVKYIFFKEPKEPEYFDGLWGGKYSGCSCPFLDNNECSIYSVRPYKCRRYISFKDEPCDGSLNGEDISYIHIYSEMTYEKIVSYYNKKKKIIDHKIYDIRDFFQKK